MTDLGENEASREAPARPGVYSRGSETVDRILKAALRVMVDKGWPAFTLRRIASECGLQVGNVSRHFPRKEMLVQVLLDERLTMSEELVEHNIREAGISAEEALGLVIASTLDDMRLKETTHFFPELWAMSNHNDFVASRLEASHRYVLLLIGSFVKQLNPALSDDEVETVSIFINSAMEGTTMAAGFGKPWEKKIPQLKALYVKSLIKMVKTITSEDIRLL